MALHRTTIFLTEEMRTKLLVLSRETGVPQSEIVRRAIDARLSGTAGVMPIAGRLKNGTR